MSSAGNKASRSRQWRRGRPRQTLQGGDIGRLQASRAHGRRVRAVHPQLHAQPRLLPRRGSYICKGSRSRRLPRTSASATRRRVDIARYRDEQEGFQVRPDIWWRGAAYGEDFGCSLTERRRLDRLAWSTAPFRGRGGWKDEVPLLHSSSVSNGCFSLGGRASLGRQASPQVLLHQTPTGGRSVASFGPAAGEQRIRAAQRAALMSISVSWCCRRGC